jgi:hypothetical protein
MHRLRERGLRSIALGEPSRFHLAEWSVPADADPMDRSLWPLANPALGHTMEFESLEARAEGPNRTAFCRASLNMWVSSSESWLVPGAWEACAGQVAPLEGGVLAVESSFDGDTLVGVRAVPAGDGVAVQPAFVVRDVRTAWEEIDRLMTADRKLRLAVTPSVELGAPPRYSGKYQTVGMVELGQMTGLVRQMVFDRRVVHDGDPTLAEHVNRAAKGVTLGSSHMTLSSARSPGPIELCRCMVWAVGLVIRPQTARRPAMGFSRTG